MEDYSKKSWHLEVAEAARQTPNLIPDDIVFQFKRRQPYRFHKKQVLKLQNIEKPPIVHTRNEKQFRVRSETSCRARPTKSNHFSSNSSRNSDNTSKIEKRSLKLLQEIDQIFGKENNLRKVFTPCEYSKEDQQEICQDFKDLSTKISRLSKGRAPLSNLRIEMYKK
jgi:hypothetical protein